jgi:hypothetical protein
MSKLTKWVVERMLQSIPWGKVLTIVGGECDRFIMEFSEDANMRSKVEIAKLLRDEIDDILYDAPF